MINYGFLTVIFAYFIQYGYANIPTIVHTKYGDVLGYQSELARVFYGIPFAQPPVDKLRYNYRLEMNNIFL